MGKPLLSQLREDKRPSSDISKQSSPFINYSHQPNNQRKAVSLMEMMKMNTEQRQNSKTKSSSQRNSNKSIKSNKFNISRSSKSRNSFTMIQSRNLSSPSIPSLLRPKSKRKMSIGRHLLLPPTFLSSGKLSIVTFNVSVIERRS
jgi:hypothetical protein